MLAAVAAGEYETLLDAMARMNCLAEGVYTPCADDSEIYDRLYEEYLTLHDFFGLENDVMKRLRALKIRVKEGK